MAVWPRTHRVVIGVQNGGVRYIRVTHYTVALWDIGKSPPTSAKIAGALSLVWWLSVITFGRPIGFAASATQDPFATL
jgi:hypothetical protein